MPPHIRKILAVAVGTVLLGAPVSAPAVADGAMFSDARGDAVNTSGGQTRQYDIWSLDAAVNRELVAVTLEFDPAGRAEFMQVDIGFDVDGDGVRDYEVRKKSGGDAYGPHPYDVNAGPSACTSPAYHHDVDTLNISFPASCIGSPDRLRFAIAVLLGGVAADQLPDGGAFTAPVRADNWMTRLAGNDRFETAAAISRHLYPQGARQAFVVNGENFADALAAGPAAAFTGAPVLLVGRDRLPAATADELRRLTLSQVVVVGGTTAVSDSVLQQVIGVSGGNGRRIAGQDRYDTARELAETFWPAGAGVAAVATGEKFADALAGGNAFAGANGPLLLTPTEELAEPTRDYLTGSTINEVRVLGGPSAVADPVAAEAISYGLSGGRVAGKDRFDTSVQISKADWSDGAGNVFLAIGTDFPDALAGVPAVAMIGGPLLLVQKDCMPKVVADEVTRLGATSTFVFGGTSTVSVAAATGQSVCPA